MRAHRLLLLLLSLCGLGLACLRAEDIDLFRGGGSGDPVPPNVLVYLDNTSNWSADRQGWSKSTVLAKCGQDLACQGYVTRIFGDNSSLTQGQVEVSSLKLVLDELVCHSANPLRLRVGLMMIKPGKGAYSDNAGTRRNSNGIAGVLRRAVMPLDASRCVSLMEDLDTIRDHVTSPEWKAASDANYGGGMFEAFKYLGGHTHPAGVAAGGPGTPQGHVGFGPKRFGTEHDLEDPLAFTETRPPYLTYQSPITTPGSNDCLARNYLLLVGNGYPNADDTLLLGNLGYVWDASRFPLAGNGRVGDVWARFLATTDVSPLAGQQTVRTYVMNVYNARADEDQTLLLKSMARNGNGGYYEVGGSLSGLVDSFRNFFTSINAANQSFAPAAMPASSVSGSLNLNQVYLGMFRPDKSPRWFGNLKMYRFGLNGVDARGNPNVYLGDSRTPPGPIQGGTGFIADDAISFWTQDSNFWHFRCGEGTSTGDPLLCGMPISPSDWPDGAVVEKGGAGQRLRVVFAADVSNSARKVLTDDGSSLVAFDATHVTDQLDPPGQTLSRDERSAIVNWARGVDNPGENTAGPNGPRPSITGDVLHAEPVAVNYRHSSANCAAAPSGDDVVVYYADNHGMLRAVLGGQNAGEELWSYIPSDFLGRLKRLRDNAPPVSFPAPVPAGDFNKPYLIDGALSVHSQDKDGNCKPDKVWVFLTMRRGGRLIAALDVTDKDKPVLLWKKTNADAGFAELGQSWSRLKPISLVNGKTALVFGAGYDPAAEDRPFDIATGRYGSPISNSRTMGRGVFVLTLDDSGQIENTRLLSAGSHSIPSDVAIVTDVNTGIAERAYVGDTGGNLWGISFRDTATGLVSADSGKWSIGRLASLGGTDADARGFFYPPDVARCTGRDVLLIGSGDREKPFDRSVLNRFFMIRDGVTGIGSDDLSDLTLGGAPDPDKQGWFMTLGVGEKTTGSAATQSGVTYFPTNQAPDISGAECGSAFGTARVYGIACATGGPSLYVPDGTQVRSQIIPGGGYIPSPVSSVLTLVDNVSGEPRTVETLLMGTRVAASKSVPMRRRISYWYREGQD